MVILNEWAQDSPIDADNILSLSSPVDQVEFFFVIYFGLLSFASPSTSEGLNTSSSIRLILKLLNKIIPLVLK